MLTKLDLISKMITKFFWIFLLHHILFCLVYDLVYLRDLFVKFFLLVGFLGDLGTHLKVLDGFRDATVF